MTLVPSIPDNIKRYELFWSTLVQTCDNAINQVTFDTCSSYLPSVLLEITMKYYHEGFAYKNVEFLSAMQLLMSDIALLEFANQIVCHWHTWSDQTNKVVLLRLEDRPHVANASANANGSAYAYVPNLRVYQNSATMDNEQFSGATICVAISAACPLRQLYIKDKKIHVDNSSILSFMNPSLSLLTRQEKQFSYFYRSGVGLKQWFRLTSITIGELHSILSFINITRCIWEKELFSLLHVNNLRELRKPVEDFEDLEDYRQIKSGDILGKSISLVY
jgi:hypothetical protein